jgi:hypothetical protein
MEFVGATCGGVAEGESVDRGTIEETPDPIPDRKIELNASSIDEQRDLPGADRTQVDRPATVPTGINRGTGSVTQILAAAVQPQRNVRIEQDGVRQRLISLPVAASGSTSSTGAVRSMPWGTLTDPG